MPEQQARKAILAANQTALKARFATVYRRALAAAGEDPTSVSAVALDRVSKTPTRLGEAGIVSDAALGKE